MTKLIGGKNRTIDDRQEAWEVQEERRERRVRAAMTHDERMASLDHLTTAADIRDAIAAKRAAVVLHKAVAAEVRAGCRVGTGDGWQQLIERDGHSHHCRRQRSKKAFHCVD